MPARFDKGEGDRLIERILPVAPRDAASTKAAYKITVHTSGACACQRWMGLVYRVLCGWWGQRA